MKTKIPLFAILICISGFKSIATGNLALQNGNDSNQSLLVSFVPQTMMVNGFRLDIERRLVKNHWLILAPVFYTTLRNNYHVYDQDLNNQEDLENFHISGFGAMIWHKIYFNKNLSCNGMYISYGLKYNSLSIDYQKYTWTKYMENGLEYWGWRLKDINEDIGNFGFNFVAGSQNFIYGNIFFLDVYAGLGYQFATVKLEGTDQSSFSDALWDYGFQGPHPIIGFRIGAVIY